MKITQKLTDELVIWFERYVVISPNRIAELSKKYSNYKWFEYNDGNCDVTWVLAKNNKMAADLINFKMEENVAMEKDFTEIV